MCHMPSLSDSYFVCVCVCIYIYIYIYIHTNIDTHTNTHKVRIRWAGHVARMEDRRGSYRVVVGRHDGKRLLGSPRHRGEDNIKMNHQ